MNTNHSPTRPVDLIIDADWVLPFDQNQKMLSHHSIVVNQNTINAILPQAQAHQEYRAEQHFKLAGQALMPGLVNAHVNCGASILQNLAQDLPQSLRQQNHLIPAEQRFINEEFIEISAELAIAQMLKSGTSCFHDSYFMPQINAKVAKKYGVRARIGIYIAPSSSHPEFSSKTEIARGLQLRDDYKHQSLLDFSFASSSLNQLDADTLNRIAIVTNELAIPLHLPLHKSQGEIQQSIKAFGKRPLQRLHELGLVSPELMAVHMNQLQRKEMELLAHSGAHIIHCPQADLKQAHGICPTQELLTAGVNLALGSANYESNQFDLLTEVRMSALIGKTYTGANQANNSYEMLEMACRGSAKALGLEQQCGSLEVGKAADICAIDLNSIYCQPNYDPIAQIVYTAGREQVSHLWIDGQLKLQAGQLTEIDEAELLSRVRYWQNKIAISE